jgi:hypothetical protein
VRSSRVCCHGCGSSIPFSRSFRHCCITDVVGPLPLIRRWTTRYAVMTIRVRVPSSRNSCHANRPRGSLPCALTRDVSCRNTIWATPPGWYELWKEASEQCAVTSWDPGHRRSTHCLTRPTVGSNLDQFLFVSCSPRIVGLRFRYISKDAPSSSMEVVGSELMLWEKIRISVGWRVGRGRRVYPARMFCDAVVSGGCVVVVVGVGVCVCCGSPRGVCDVSSLACRMGVISSRRPPDPLCCEWGLRGWRRV